MAEAVKPTNERIIKMLDQIPSKLAEMKNGQQELSAVLGELAETLER